MLYNQAPRGPLSLCDVSDDLGTVSWMPMEPTGNRPDFAWDRGLRHDEIIRDYPDTGSVSPRSAEDGAAEATRREDVLDYNRLGLILILRPVSTT